MREPIVWAALAMVAGACGPTPVALPEAVAPTPEAGDPVVTDALLVEWKANGGELRPLELDGRHPTYGEEAIPLGMYAVRAVSADGRTLAALVYPRNDAPRDARLHWIDIASWQARTSRVGFDAWVSSMAFGPDGSTLAIAYALPGVGGRAPEQFGVQLIDVALDQVVAEAALEAQPVYLAFSSDGALLTVYGSAPFLDTQTASDPPVVSIFDGRNLTLIESLVLEGVVEGVTPLDDESLPEPWLYWSPAVVFSLDGRTLYVIHADRDRLTRVDLETRQITHLDIAPPRSWLERLLTLGVETADAKGAGGGLRRGVISPDGTRLFAVGSLTEPATDDQGNLSFTTTPFDLLVIDAGSGVELARLETQADEVSLGRGGEEVFLRGWGPGPFGWTEVFDVATLQLADRFDHARLFSVRDSAGRWLYLSVVGSNSSKVSVVDAATGTELAEWQFGTPGGVEIVELP